LRFWQGFYDKCHKNFSLLKDFFASANLDVLNKYFDKDYQRQRLLKTCPNKSSRKELRAYPGIRPGWMGMICRQIMTAQAKCSKAK